MSANTDYQGVSAMPDIVLRDTGTVGPNDEDGRELARAWVPTNAVEDVVKLIDRAIGWGHDLSYVEVKPTEQGA